MRNRFAAFAGVLAIAALITLTFVPAAAQAQKAASKASTPPRMPDGHPDLQGTYDVATLTPVDRPPGANATYSKDEAKKLEINRALTREKGDQSIAGNRTAPPKGGDGSVGAAGNVGGYNSGWLDPG